MKSVLCVSINDDMCDPANALGYTKCIALK